MTLVEETRTNNDFVGGPLTSKPTGKCASHYAKETPGVYGTRPVIV